MTQAELEQHLLSFTKQLEKERGHFLHGCLLLLSPEGLECINTFGSDPVMLKDCAVALIDGAFQRYQKGSPSAIH